MPKFEAKKGDFAKIWQKLATAPSSAVHAATVHISYSLPLCNSRGGLPVVQHRVTRLAEVTFLHVNRTQKLPQGKSSLAHAHY